MKLKDQFFEPTKRSRTVETFVHECGLKNKFGRLPLYSSCLKPSGPATLK